ncbi:DnaJ-like protein subfamily C member 3 [Armadillidium vulgare]|nr:DnaJ-like protein subfamily C member 3 [Armadillidium vulgare]
MGFYKTSNTYKSLYSLWMFMASLDIFLYDVECISPAEIDKHLQMSVQLLAKGQLHDALSHLHAAIDGDPNNYLSYYRRATVYLALGRSRMGLQDLDSTIKLKPDFTAARVQKASVLVKLGRLDEAYIELEKVLQKDPSNEEANTLLRTHNMLKEKYIYAHNNFQSKHYNEVLSVLKDIIEASPWDSSMREMRCETFKAMGDTMSAIVELRTITKLTQDNTGGFLQLASLYYEVGDVDQALSEVRECLKLDPDHKECFSLYKRVKKIAKFTKDAQEYSNNKEYTECVSSAKKILKEEPNEKKIRFIGFDKLCQCEGEGGSPNLAITACNEALQINDEARIYCDRAEAHILNEDYDSAINDFKAALNKDSNLQRANQGLEKAQKLKKQAGKRDYYKILGVKRNASKREITKAYRSMAQKWHPDHYEGEEKEKAEKMFIDIAAAKEVLTDDEKRAKFDNGEDPLDPEQNHGFGEHGFNPFQHFHFRPRGWLSRRGISWRRWSFSL